MPNAAFDFPDRVADASAGRAYLANRLGVPSPVLAALSHLGLSSIANLLGAIAFAKHYALNRDDIVLTVATDGHEMYASELERYLQRRHNSGELSEVLAAELTGRYLLGPQIGCVLEATARERARIFNLGYFTWVEQQGVALADFERRRGQEFWRSLQPLVAQWDEMITSFNRELSTAAA